jgi:hypothetical protein
MWNDGLTFHYAMIFPETRRILSSDWSIHVHAQGLSF